MDIITRMENFQGIFGIASILLIAFFLSENQQKINKKTILNGIILQFLLGVFILVTPIGKPIFQYLDSVVTRLISFADAGSDFLFQSYISGAFEPALVNFAFRTLPTVIFFSALISVLYHFGIIQLVVKGFAIIFQKILKTSGSESLSVSANIFLGQTESPLLVRPFVKTMTKSELATVMIGGFATAAGGVLAIYVGWLSDIPGIAGHLLTASVMSAPAAIVIAKIIFPEIEDSKTMGNLNIQVEKTTSSAMEALASGASSGLKLAANIAAMLIAFLAILAMINYLLSFLGVSLESILGFIFMPLAWAMGAPWHEASTLGALMGKKLVFTELIAYTDLQTLINSQAISERTSIIAAYALCGFANFGSIGIQLGGIGSMAPDRMRDLSSIVAKAMIGGALASWLTASIAGILL
jgi:CNT family concentrative nucleoside transporter